jgi:hypothetical protein
MADKKITELTAETTPLSTDLLPIVIDPSGSPETRKITIANLLANVVSIQGTWNPTFTGFSASPANPICRYILVGKMCTCFIQMPAGGASNAATFYISAPFTALTVANMIWYGHIGTMQDNSAWVSPVGQVVIVSGENIFRLHKTTTGNDGWTTNNNKVANFSITYEIA